MKLTRLFLIGALSAACAGIIGCSKADKAEAEVVEGPAVTVLSVDSALSTLEALAGDTIVVEGYCKHICKHGGKKAFLANADTTALLMCVVDNNLPAFAPDCPGQVLTVCGVVTPITMGRTALAARAEAEAKALAAAEAEGHCDSERKANGSAVEKLAKLDEQIAAGGDTTLVCGYYVLTTSYAVPETPEAFGEEATE